jgi:hypothetical protein
MAAHPSLILWCNLSVRHSFGHGLASLASHDFGQGICANHPRKHHFGSDMTGISQEAIAP